MVGYLNNTRGGGSFLKIIGIIVVAVVVGCAINGGLNLASGGSAFGSGGSVLYGGSNIYMLPIPIWDIDGGGAKKSGSTTNQYEDQFGNEINFSTTKVRTLLSDPQKAAMNNPNVGGYTNINGDFQTVDEYGDDDGSDWNKRPHGH